MKKIATTPLLFLGGLCINLFISCSPDDAKPGECNFDAQNVCSGFSFSIVDNNTFENLIGEGKLIDPIKVVVTNTRTDTMYQELVQYPASNPNWFVVEYFNPFQEITCFNLCKLDSAFTRTYYINYGGADTDTMEVRFPVRSELPLVYFNQVKGLTREEKPDEIAHLSHWSSFWFLKETNE